MHVSSVSPLSYRNTILNFLKYRYPFINSQGKKYPGCQRVFSLLAKLRLWAAKPLILPREKKNPSGRSSYKPHFHAILKPNTSPNRFLWHRFAFVIDMSAHVATMRETAQKLSQDEEERNCQAEYYVFD